MILLFYHLDYFRRNTADEQVRAADNRLAGCHPFTKLVYCHGWVSVVFYDLYGRDIQADGKPLLHTGEIFVG